MLLLLPQDLVPLKQGLWFDRLPVLGLQSHRPVGMVVLLSTCSWLLCVCPLVCVLLPSTLLCPMSLGFPHWYREDPRGTLLNGKETAASSCVESHVILSLLWQGQQVEIVLLLWILCHRVNRVRTVHGKLRMFLVSNNPYQSVETRKTFNSTKTQAQMEIHSFSFSKCYW